MYCLLYCSCDRHSPYQYGADTLTTVVGTAMLRNTTPTALGKISFAKAIMITYDVLLVRPRHQKAASLRIAAAVFTPLLGTMILELHQFNHFSTCSRLNWDYTTT